MKTIEYHVEFTTYHYNTGRADNGTIKGYRSVETLEDAKKFHSKLQRLLELREENNESFSEEYEELENWFDDEIDDCGYLKSVGDIYKVIIIKELIH